MPPLRTLILGNSGAGKTTLARRLAQGREVGLLSLDEVAWDPGPARRPLAQSLAAIDAFIAGHDEWIIEGCYGDLIEALLPRCGELIFLNPGVEACLAHCRARPWEPDKFATPEEQEAALDFLLDWVGQYEARDDEFGLARHRAIFERFGGAKREIGGPWRIP